MGSLGSPIYGQTAIPYQGGWLPTNLQQRLYPPNDFNRCLIEEMTLWHAMNASGRFQDLYGKKYVEPPWVKMPGQGKKFLYPDSIALPDADGLDHLVASFTVPHGFDAVITNLVCNYSGQGFAEGSGDLTWRVAINIHYLDSFGSMQFSVGEMPITPFTNDGGRWLVQSDDLVQFFVNRSLTASGLAGGRIICAFSGYRWPR
jgi:hypothetical protein